VKHPPAPLLLTQSAAAEASAANRESERETVMASSYEYLFWADD
jgi:hypothetical protein